MTDMEGISKTGIKSMNATIRLQPAVEVAITVSSYVEFVVMALKKGMRNVMMETETHLMVATSNARSSEVTHARQSPV